MIIISNTSIMGDRNTSIETIHDQAMDSLTCWIESNKSTGLCDLKQLNFGAGNVPYHKEHIQDLYLLRYYAAYLAENEMAYTWLKKQGVATPVIVSIGCGCHVDEQAAHIVFGEYSYYGYDIVRWHIKPVNNINFIEGDIFTQTIPEDTNIIMFPKSVGDVCLNAQKFKSVFDAKNLKSDTIWVVATYRNIEEKGCESDRKLLENVLKTVEDTFHYEREYEFDGRNHGQEYIGDKKHAGWLKIQKRHLDFVEKIAEKCEGTTAECPKEDCGSMNHSCMLLVKHLAFDIYKLTRKQ